MNRGNDNAFPIFNQHGECLIDSVQGLSVREYFAAMAMQGMLASPYAKDMAVEHGNFAQEKFALSSVMFADALIAELQKGEAK